MKNIKCSITLPIILGGTTEVFVNAEETLVTIIQRQLGEQKKFIMDNTGKPLAHVRCFLNGVPIHDLNQKLPIEKNELLFLTAMSGG